VRQPPQSLERELDLSNAPGKRNAQSHLRVFAERAVGLETMPDLEALHGFDERAS